jgi:hypothetical protein
MIRKTLLAVTAMSLLASAAFGASCTDPKTHKFIKCPPPATATVKTTTTTTTHTSGPVCKTGKPCGNSCIAKNKVCHK